MRTEARNQYTFGALKISSIRTVPRSEAKSGTSFPPPARSKTKLDTIIIVVRELAEKKRRCDLTYSNFGIILRRLDSAEVLVDKVYTGSAYISFASCELVVHTNQQVWLDSYCSLSGIESSLHATERQTRFYRQDDRSLQQEAVTIGFPDRDRTHIRHPDIRFDYGSLQ